jgi:hypothetical protein
MRNQLQRISASRKLSVVAVERVCRAVMDRNPEGLYGSAYAEARKHVGKRIDARVASFGLSFSDPKSVSLLAAGSSPEVRAEVQAARHTAIRKVVGWLEQEAVGVRRGRNGVDRFRGSGSRGRVRSSDQPRRRPAMAHPRAGPERHPRPRPALVGAGFTEAVRPCDDRRPALSRGAACRTDPAAGCALAAGGSAHRGGGNRGLA